MAFEDSAFQRHTGINWNGHVGVVQYGSDNLVVLFHSEAVHNPGRSRDTGSPQYDDVVYVRVHPPGERLNIVDRPCTDHDKRRWPMQWQQFCQNREQIPGGVPIQLLYPDHPSISAMLKAHGVHTVEQCAELSGVAIDQIGMGAQRYSNDAKKYMEVANKGVSASQLRSELDERDSQIRVLKQQIDILKGEVNRMQTAGSTDQMAALQTMVMQMAQRPQMPINNPTPAFDHQAAMINANHTTNELRKPRRPFGSRAKNSI